MTDTQAAAERIAQLRTELDTHNYRYYVLDDRAFPTPNTIACSASCRRWRPSTRNC